MQSFVALKIHTRSLISQVKIGLVTEKVESTNKNEVIQIFGWLWRLESYWNGKGKMLLKKKHIEKSLKSLTRRKRLIALFFFFFFFWAFFCFPVLN